MTTRVIRNDSQRAELVRLLEAMPYPYTSDVVKGEKRSIDQNRLQRLWCGEAAEQLQDESADDKRAYCKLTLGVPILRADSTRFREEYDRVVRPLPYETKLALMKEPFDFPVTRLMTTAQKTQYLDAMWHHFSALGVSLTDPDANKYWGIPRVA